MSFHKHNIELAGTMTLGPKGQVVIPAETRERMDIKPGDKLVALYMPDSKAVGIMSEKELQTMIDKMGSHFDALKNKLGR